MEGERLEAFIELLSKEDEPEMQGRGHFYLFPEPSFPKALRVGEFYIAYRVMEKRGELI